MAIDDFRPYASRLGGHLDIRYFPLNAGADFQRGEPVMMVGSGEIELCADDAADDIVGVAATSGKTDGARNTPADTGAGALSTQTYPVTSADGFPDDTDAVGVYLASDVDFITSRFATDGAGTLAVPTIANAIGEDCSMQVASDVWFVDTGGGTMNSRIIDVLDANFTSLTAGGGTGVYVVFRIIDHQLSPAGAVPAPPAAT
jgi:hypothetical protein